MLGKCQHLADAFWEHTPGTMRRCFFSTRFLCVHVRSGFWACLCCLHFEEGSPLLWRCRFNTSSWLIPDVHSDSASTDRDLEMWTHPHVRLQVQTSASHESGAIENGFRRAVAACVWRSGRKRGSDDDPSAAARAVAAAAIQETKQ